MMNPVVWIQDAPPHRRGTFSAAVFQGESQSQNAGPTMDGVSADPWSVKVPISTAIVAVVKIGDTLQLSPNFGCAELTIQQITKTPGWYILRCIANERAPMP